MPISRALLYIYPSGPLVIEPSLQVPLAELPQREMFHYQSSISSVSQSLQETSPPPGPQQGKWQCLFPEPSFTHLSKAPKKRSPGKTKSQLSLQVPSKGTPSMIPNRDPTETDDLFPKPMVYSFIHISQSTHLRSSPTKQRGSIWSMSMEPQADRRPTHNEAWPGSQGDCSQHCNYYPNAMQLSAQYLQPWLG